MSSSVTLSASTRQNLLSLQDTAGLASTNQSRLSTGKKVNSALDNPVNYFTAQALNNRSSALSSLLDGISNGIQTIQAASKGIDSTTSLVKQLQSTIKQAQSNAANNLPKISGTVALASSAEAIATQKSQHDTALAKGVFGSATPATSSVAGNLGFTDSTSATISNTVQLKAGNTTYSFNLASSATLGDLVNGINQSGIGTASVDSNGQLSVTGTGSDKLSVAVGSSVTATGVFTAGSSADTEKLFGNGVSISNVQNTTTSAARSSLITQFNDVRSQIDQLAKDSGYNGTNLLGGDKLSISFNEKTGSALSKLDVQGTLVSSDKLGVGKLVDSSDTQTNGDFGVQNNADLTKAADALTNALTTLSSLSSTFGSNLATVQTRQDFTKQLADVLNTGASNLVNADMNEEAANSNALSTRQSLGISALSLANTANQGILQLLR